MPADAPFAGSQDPAVVRLAIPSKGNMEEPTLAFLGACGLRVQRDNPRQYSARVAGQPTVRAVFQRPSDIPPKLADGIVDIGITGYDVYREHVGDTNDVIVAMDDLGFARCELVLAVPEAWVDVSSIRDLVELAADFRAEGRRLRIATGYPRLVRDFLLRTDISNFSLVESAGALEISPVLGYADLIADINQTGTTLRANHLKPLAGGTILRSQACLLIHRQGFRASAAKRSILRTILELIEAQQRARQYYSVVANMRGRSVQEVAAAINSRPELAGIQGPTLSEVIAHRETEYHWYAVTLVVTTARLINVIDHLRAIGGSGITVTEARYVFEDICQTYARLASSLGDDTSSSLPAAP
ncbi:MAG: ATP phosphoribosyltransferase [Chloroflexota bacterium]